MRSGNEGGMDLRQMIQLYVISKETVSNYRRHVALYLYKNLHESKNAAIRWNRSERRKVREGLVYAILKAIGFVYGTSVKTFRPTNGEKQSNKCCGHHHFHFCSVLLWTDVFGSIMKVDMTKYGSEIIEVTTIDENSINAQGIFLPMIQQPSQIVASTAEGNKLFSHEL